MELNHWAVFVDWRHGIEHDKWRVTEIYVGRHSYTTYYKVHHDNLGARYYERQNMPGSVYMVVDKRTVKNNIREAKQLDMVLEE